MLHKKSQNTKTPIHIALLILHIFIDETDTSMYSQIVIPEYLSSRSVRPLLNCAHKVFSSRSLGPMFSVSSLGTTRDSFDFIRFFVTKDNFTNFFPEFMEGL